MRVKTLVTALAAGKRVAKKPKGAIARMGAYRIVHFGLRKSGKENMAMPQCVADDVRRRYPDGTLNKSFHNCVADFSVVSQSLGFCSRIHRNLQQRVSFPATFFFFCRVYLCLLAGNILLLLVVCLPVLGVIVHNRVFVSNVL